MPCNRYIVIGDDCSSQSNESLNVYVKDNFKLRYKFVDHRYSPTLVVPPKYVNIIIKFEVLGRPEYYIASQLDGVCTNCMIDEGSNTLVVIFDNHGLEPGRLYASYKYLIRDPDFPDGEAQRYEGGDTGITLTDSLF